MMAVLDAEESLTMCVCLDTIPRDEWTDRQTDWSHAFVEEPGTSTNVLLRGRIIIPNFCSYTTNVGNV